MAAHPSDWRRPSRWTRSRIAFLVAVLAIYGAAIRHIDMRWSEFVDGLPAIAQLLSGMFPPDWKYLGELGPPVVQTLQVGIIATVMASLAAVPLAYLAARNFSPHPVLYHAVRLVLTTFRAISEIIWALLLVVAVGLGPFAGVLALAIFATGVIAKLLAEALEAVEPGPLEAMTSAGAPRWKVFLYAAWPQVLPNYLSYCLYYWDHNTRQAIVLGFVGAGGVGYALLFNLNSYYFDKAVTALIVLVVMIVAIDRFCLWLRSRLH